MDDSILARVAQPVSVVFKPLGFGDWKPTAATVTGLVAKEEVVANFGIMYAYDDQEGEEELEENGDQIWDRVAEDFNTFSNGHGRLAAFAFMIFNLLCRYGLSIPRVSVSSISPLGSEYSLLCQRKRRLSSESKPSISVLPQS